MVTEMDAFAKSGERERYRNALRISRYLKQELPKVNTYQYFKDAFTVNKTKDVKTGVVTYNFSQYVIDQLNTIEAVSANLNLDPTSEDHVDMFIKHFREVKHEFDENMGHVFLMPQARTPDYIVEGEHSKDKKDQGNTSTNETGTEPPVEGAAVPAEGAAAPAAPVAEAPPAEPENLEAIHVKAKALSNQKINIEKVLNVNNQK